ncbi:MAG: TRAP transporter small permease [Candidatus Pacebacteria bacterium]|nr:TRAP transporter small permease [Candidatus Paceibacterota bacterium]
MAQPLVNLSQWYTRSLRTLVYATTALAGTAVVSMTIITTLDVLGRALWRPLPGAYDLVTVLGGLAIACALPYTTAVKGHVAVEFFFHKLRRRARIVVDTVNRCIGMALFAVLGWQTILYARALRLSGEVTPTLELPLYPVVYVVAVVCFLVVLVILHHLVHPGREMIRP